MLDVAIIGGGLSGSVAAAVLGRAGYQVALVDRHPVYPPDFRGEHLDGTQSQTLSRLGLLDGITAGVPCVRQVAWGRRGRMLGIRPTVNYGMKYHSIVNAARSLLPPAVTPIIGRVTDIETGPDIQRVRLADQRVVTARLLIIATGLGYAICSRLGVTRRVLHKGHSLTFGFDLMPQQGDRFRYPFYVYQGERRNDCIDYVSAFEINETMRVNLFTFRDYRDSWTRDFEQAPDQTLATFLPGLEKVMGAYRVVGPVQVRAMDLYATDHAEKPGFALIGDAFQTACPAAGQGMTRALSDVERLCTVHVPRWLETPGMSADKIAAFYADPLKQQADTHAMHTAHYRRAVTIETGLKWSLHRQRLATQTLAQSLMDRFRPAAQPQIA